MKIGTNDISKIYLGSAEIEKIYLGTEQVFGDSEPAESYKFKLIDNQGNEYVNNEDDYSVDFGSIDMFMSDEGISPENIVELQIGDYVTEVNDINLQYINNFYNVSGITVGKNVTVIRRISDAQTSPDTGNIQLQWIKLKCKSIPDISSHRDNTFENTNCCPILVRYSLMLDYKNEWSQWTDFNCDVRLSDRIGTYEEIPYEVQYLTFVAEADNCAIYAVDAHSNVFQYSVDSGKTWSDLANNGSTTSVNSGQTIMFKAYDLTVDSSDGIGTLRPSANASVQGNVMSLVYGDNFIGQTTITNYNQFKGLFFNSANITSAENLILPATTLRDSCYRSMFTSCTSLRKAPELPATTLAYECYYQMFRGCSNLNYVKCIATDIAAPQCTSGWLYGVANSGTFVKAVSMNDWKSDSVNGIPNGWTVLNDGEEPPHDYSQDYLTTESLDDNNTISFTMGTGMTTAITTAVTSVSVSTDDGVTWTSMQNIGANASLSVTLNNGDKAIWKGDAIGYSIATASTKSTLFSSTGTYKVYGNITSLLYDNNFKNQNNPTLPDFNCFTNLFYGSTGLTDASNLIMHFEMPATTRQRQICYLFQGCTSLTAAPELKYIGFGGSQYTFRNMFRGCTSLTAAPELPATALTQGCYAYMFQDCTSLTTAPELPATTLTQACYQNMFNGCTSLNYIKCLATDISASNSRSSWVSGVAATGTFVKAASMSSWTTGTAGIPTGWTIQNDDGTPYINDNWDDQE